MAAMKPIVALDIETTGLDPEKDAIIEIGAVKFNDNRIEGEWSTLVNPGRQIPPYITQLTGITDQMVVHSPSIHQVVRGLDDFVGECHLLGHNIRFDLSFLNKQKILLADTYTDTYELASVLLPTASRYNLGSLVKELGVLIPATHRALDDAQATRGIFLRLYEEIQNLPFDLLVEILRLSEGLDWGASWAFDQVYQSRVHESKIPQKIHHINKGPIYEDHSISIQKPLEPKDTPLPLNLDELCDILEIGGQFNQHFPNYEFRSQQSAMLRAVGKALSKSQHLMVEAGTGTGKSMAYLIPAAFWALQNEHRVVISTNTINLQDQLIKKDIPDLNKALNINLRSIVVKGRSNYFCPRRFSNMLRHNPESVEEVRVIAKTLVWLRGTSTGDRAELNLNSQTERDIWLKFSAEDQSCSNENCITRMGGICPYHRVHQAAQDAHLIIVNHALLLTDVATGNKVIPEYQYLIVDEAHHLEDATTNALSYRITQYEIDRLLKSIGGSNSGVLGRIIIVVKEIFDPSDFASIHHLIATASDITFRLENQITDFFRAVGNYLYEVREGKPIGQYSFQYRIDPSSRTQPSWADIEIAWDDIDKIIKPLKTALEKILQAMVENLVNFAQTDEELFSELSSFLYRLGEFQENISGLVFQPNLEKIYWLEQKNENKGFSLNIAPLNIGTLMQKHLWYEKSSVILTSATLTTSGDFNYIRRRLNNEDAEELALGSPFDYDTSTLVYLVNDIPEPTDRRNYQRFTENGLINLCKATSGRTLVLFTSYDQLKRTAQAISPILAKDNILVYEQGEGASAHSLLESFRLAEKAVLLGTRAFWEGIDVPGEALSVLVITKLPFNVPTDPIVSARAETFEDPFYEFSLPEAILRFRQGFGRLIRSKSDRGAVIILDRRILTKKYGKYFISSLPECTFQTGNLANAPKEVCRWLGL